MKITLFGAAGNVTGSAYYLQTINSNILVDFGIFQGDRTMEANNHQLPPFDIDTLNAVIITHAHLDHTGRLPLLSEMVIMVRFMLLRRQSILLDYTYGFCPGSVI